MESIQELYRVGRGPSSSHTMGPSRAAEILRVRFPEAASYRVGLFGSLAATGRGHLTDLAIREVLQPQHVDFEWHPGNPLPFHPNGMRFESLDTGGVRLRAALCARLFALREPLLQVPLDL